MTKPNNIAGKGDKWRPTNYKKYRDSSLWSNLEQLKSFKEGLKECDEGKTIDMEKALTTPPKDI